MGHPLCHLSIKQPRLAPALLEVMSPGRGLWSLTGHWPGRWSPWTEQIVRGETWEVAAGFLAFHEKRGGAWTTIKASMWPLEIEPETLRVKSYVQGYLSVP